MRVLLRQEGDWTCVEGTSPVVNNYIQSYIRPIAYRVWENGVWRVHKDQVPNLLKLLDKYGIGYNMSTDPVVDAYSVLFLLPNAPKEVVVAAYRALALLYHPDKGDQSERMSLINAAWEEIKTKW